MTPIDLPPLSPFGSELPIMSSALAVERVTSTIDECTRTRDSLINSLRDSIADCLKSCDGHAERCHDCISGRIHILLDSANSTVDKCAQKIAAKMSDNLGSAYWYASAYVGEPPTVDDLTIWVDGGMRQTAPQIQAVSTQVQQPITGQAVTLQPAASSQGECRPPIFIGSCGPPGTPIPDIVCPPGYKLQRNTSDECYYCVDTQCGPVQIIPPLPTPYPQPFPTPSPQPSCPIEGTDCGPGMEEIVSVINNEIVRECHPIVAPCPTPVQQCPEGFEWVYDTVARAYQCRKTVETAPPKPVPKPGDSKLGLLDIIGLYEWNAPQCPDFSAVVYSGIEAEEAKKSADSVLSGAAASVSSSVAVSGLGVPGDVLNGFTGAVVTGFFDVIGVIYDWCVEEMTQYAPCNIVGAVGIFAVRGALSFVEEWTNIGFDEVITHLDHAFRYHCPAELPGQGDIDEAYLRNTITQDTWRCWTRAVNDMDKPAERILIAKRSQPSIGDWIRAEWRKLLTPAQLNDKLRGQGILQGDDKAVFVEMQRPLPHLGEVMRYIADGIGDALYVQRYDLQFKQGDIRSNEISNFLDATGATLDTYDYAWRNHFRLISLPEMAQMTWRFRADSLNAKWQGLVLDDADIKYVVDGNNIPGYWAERLRELYRPTVSFRQLHLLAEFGGWNSGHIADALKTDGWRDETADIISRSIVKQIDEAEFKSLSVLSPHVIGSAYANGYIGIGEFYAMFTIIGEEKSAADVTFTQATWLRTIDQRKDLIGAIHSRFNSGEFDKNTAVEELSGAGLPIDQALILASGWEYKNAAKGKEFVPSELCNLFDNGLIDGTEYYKRLLRLGWNAGDATKHVTLCGIRISAKAQASAARNKPKPGRGPRLLSVAELCTMYGQGIIDIDGYHSHMARQGFEREDAEKLIQSCIIRQAGKNGTTH